MQLKHILSFLLIPFLFGLYPVIYLTAENIWELNIIEVLRPAVFFLFCTLLLLVLIRFIYKSWQKASLAFSIFMIWFFSYSFVHDFIYGIPLFGLVIGRHRLLFPAWVGLLGLFFWWFAQKPRLSVHLVSIFTIAGLGLWILPVGKLANYLIVPKHFQAESSALAEMSLQKPEPNPDVYYIILDTYTRQDALQNIMGYDNSNFIHKLEGMGFYVASCSQSNYENTVLSLGSSLNMDYLPIVMEKKSLNSAILTGAVQKIFSQMGYKIVAFETGFHFSELHEADIYLAPPHYSFQTTPFEDLILKTTVARVFYDTFVRPDQIHTARELYILDQLKRLPDMEGPKFIFVHLVVPHPPFVFGPGGVLAQPFSNIYDNNGTTIIDYENYKVAYKGQLEFINQQIIPILQSIIKRSKTPPIIILQGDHGFYSGEKVIFSILNSYYFPDQNYSNLYKHVSPVNTFRLIFNQFFHGRFDILPDSSYREVGTPPPEKEICVEK